MILRHFPTFEPGRRTPAPRLTRMGRALEAEGNTRFTAGVQQFANHAGRLTNHQMAIRQDQFALLELTEFPNWPTWPNGSKSDVAKVPWINNCKFVEHQGSSPHNWQTTDDIEPVTVYCPNVVRNDDGIGIGVDHVGIGDRIWCIFNQQSGEWEDLTPPQMTWPFQLSEPLTQWADEPVCACLRYWDPNKHTNWGGYTVTVDVCFEVADWRKVGYFGSPGANGAALMRRATNGLVGVIVDLQCPDGCLCGSESPERYECFCPSSICSSAGTA